MQKSNTKHLKCREEMTSLAELSQKFQFPLNLAEMYSRLIVHLQCPDLTLIEFNLKNTYLFYRIEFSGLTAHIT